MRNVINMEKLTEFTDKFFEKNPDRILGEAKMTKDQWGKPVMTVKGSIDNIEAIDVPDVLEPVVGQDPFTAEVNVSLDETIINPENTENIEHAIEDQEKKVARRTVRRKKTDDLSIPVIEQEMYTFDEVLEQYNPGITKEEVQVWVWYKGKTGRPLQSNWQNYSVSASNKWFEEMCKKGYMCYDPIEKNYVPSPIYYSGNISEKISALLQNKDEFERHVLKGESQWQRQYDRLVEVQPGKLSLSVSSSEERLIISPISALAKDSEIFAIQRISDGTEFEDPVSLRYAFVKWLPNLPDAEFQLPVSYRDIDVRYLQAEGDRSRYVSKEEKWEKKKNARIEGDRLFAKFLYEELTAEDKKRLEQYWNSKYNAWVDVDYDKIPVGFEVSKIFKRADLQIRKAQREAIAFQSIKGSGCLAYDVGVGKTMSAILSIGQALYSGRCKRPLIIVPNATYDKWIAEIQGIYNSNQQLIGGGLLPQYPVNDLKNLRKGYIENLFDANGDFIPISDGTITMMTYEALPIMGFSEEAAKEFIVKMMAILDDGSDSEKARDIATKMLKAEGVIGKVQKDSMLDFDMLGFDFICVDEAHNMKNVFTGVKGEEDEGSKQYEIQGSVSARGITCFFITQWINDRNNGNVLLLTATPFTNQPLEVYSMLGMIGMHTLRERGIANLREFFDTFVKQTYEIAYTATFQFKSKAVIKSWNNLQTLQQLIRSYILHKTGEEAGIQRPNKIVLPLLKEKVNNIVVDLPDDRQISTFLTPTEDQQTYLKDIEHFVLKESELSDMAAYCNFHGGEEACSPNENLDDLLDKPTDQIEKGRALLGISFARAVTLSPYLYVLNCACNEDMKKPNFHKLYINTSPKLKYVMDCIRSVKQWHEKQNEDISGQVIYMDAGVGMFPYIKEYLVKEVGFKSDEVEMITGGISSDKKEKVKQDFLSGAVKVILGSSAIKEGIDLQNKTSVLYNCYLDWNPTDIKQVEGRAWRFGNQFANVRIVSPLIENSVDPFMFQKLEEKSSRINDLWSQHGKKNIFDLEEFNPEEMKLGLITDAEKMAGELIRQESSKYSIEINKIEKQIEGLDQVISIKNNISSDEQSLINSAQYKYDYLIKYYNPYDQEYTEKGEEKIRKVYVDQELAEKLNIRKVNDIKTVDQAIEFGRYYDRVSDNSEFSYRIGNYRNNKKRLMNFEKSILKPRGLTLADDIEQIREELEKEKEACNDKVSQLNSESNRVVKVKQIQAQMDEVRRKRRNIDGRVKEFASLNNKCLSEMMDYGEKQVEKTKEYKGKKEKEKKVKIAKAKAQAQAQRLRLLKL